MRQVAFKLGVEFVAITKPNSSFVASVYVIKNAFAVLALEITRDSHCGSVPNALHGLLNANIIHASMFAIEANGANGYFGSGNDKHVF